MNLEQHIIHRKLIKFSLQSLRSFSIEMPCFQTETVQIISILKWFIQSDHIRWTNKIWNNWCKMKNISVNILVSPMCIPWAHSLYPTVLWVFTFMFLFPFLCLPIHTSKYPNRRALLYEGVKAQLRWRNRRK